MKKILIFYGSYGGGHLSASRSIKDYIENHYDNMDIMMIDCIEYVNKILNKVTTKAYADFAKNAHWMWGKIYYATEDGPGAKMTTATFNLLSKKLYKLLQDYNPDVVISTHPFSSQMCAILKKKKKLRFKLGTIITDYSPHSQWVVLPAYVDYFFVAHEGMKSYLLNKGVRLNQIKVTGIPLSNKFLANYDKNKILSDFNLCPDKRTILFFAGGEQGFGADNILKILKSLISNFSDYQIIAISGKNAKIKKHFDNLVKETNSEESVRILEYTDKVPELMSASDLVITKPGGLTTTESLASGLPIIVINPIPGQEEENAEFLEKEGVAVWIKKHDDVSDKLYSILNSPETLHNMKKNARLLAKKNSTRDICKILLDNII